LDIGKKRRRAAYPAVEERSSSCREGGNAIPLLRGKMEEELKVGKERGEGRALR